MELKTVGEGNNEEEAIMTKLYLLRQNKERDINKANIIPVDAEKKKRRIKKKVFLKKRKVLENLCILERLA